MQTTESDLSRELSEELDLKVVHLHTITDDAREAISQRSEFPTTRLEAEINHLQAELARCAQQRVATEATMEAQLRRCDEDFDKADEERRHIVAGLTAQMTEITQQMAAAAILRDARRARIEKEMGAQISALEKMTEANRAALTRLRGA